MTSVYGNVSIISSQFKTGKRVFVNYARIVDKLNKCSPVLTDVHGNFCLKCVGIEPNENVGIIVSKPGLQVVNIGNLFIHTDQRDTLKIVMSSKQESADWRAKLYQVGQTSAQRKLHEQIAKVNRKYKTLLETHSKDTTEMIRLENQVGYLQAQLAAVPRIAEELADQFAIIDFDQTTPLARKAIMLYQEGKLLEAQQALSAGQYPDQIAQLLKIKERKEAALINYQRLDAVEKSKSEQLIQTLELKAGLHKLSFQFDSVKITLNQILSFAPSDSRVYSDLGFYYLSMLELDSAAEVFNMALKFSTDSSQVFSILINLGGSQAHAGNGKAAEANLQRALELRLKDSTFRSSTFYGDLAICETNLGIAFFSMNNFKESEKHYKKALALLRSHPKSGRQEAMEGVIYLNLGNVYDRQNLVSKAKDYFQNAIKWFSSLKYTDREAQQEYLGKTNLFIARIYLKQDDTAKALEGFKQAITIFRKLYQFNPKGYQDELIQSLRNLALTYQYIHQTERSFSPLMEAALIYSKPLHQDAETLFQQYTLQRAIGDGHVQIDQPEIAERYYHRALDLMKAACAKSTYYRYELASFYHALGIFYNNWQKIQESNYYFDLWKKEKQSSDSAH